MIYSDKQINRMMSVKEAAAYLRVHERTVYRLVWERQLSHHRIGRRVVLTEDDVKAFLASNRIEAVEQIETALGERR